MNVYDFDDTIYDGDSSIDFYLFCLKKDPKILKYVPKQIKATILYKFKKITKTEMKESFFAFLKDIDVKKTLKEFWDKKEHNIKEWYLKEKQDDDLIISASPEFLLSPICKKLGIKHLIASQVNPSTGKFEDENCKGEKKVELFNKLYKGSTIESFYSDSLSDEPLAKIANKAFFVTGDKIEDWPISNKKKSKLKIFTKYFIIIYGIIMLIFCSIRGAQATGEWDDYSLPTVSIMEQQNISIDDEDIENYKKLFPEWAGMINTDFLSGHITKNGGHMTWYFPIYSLICVPFIYLLNFLTLPASYTFPFTNLTVLILMLFIIYKYLNVNDKTKLLLILCLSINPIIFYLNWVSAEVLIFSLLGVSLTCWYNKWYKRAAFSIAIAGMLNPTILSIGIIMIVEYLINIIKSKKKEENLKQFILKNVKKVITYGCCYLIALVPFAYNYYNTGHINLTASTSELLIGQESTILRFISYLFDFNYGFLPYFSILFIIALILIPFAIYRKQWKYIILMSCFFINVLLYSIIIHINCGMAGIARYNTWGAVIMLFAVCLYYDKIIKNSTLKIITTILLISSTIYTGLIISRFGFIGAPNTSSIYMTPTVEKILNYVPQIYNPLHSTFNSRTSHIDGGYKYETPIVYSNADGHVKKILATEKNKEEILKNYSVISGNENWLREQIKKLSEKETYISVPYKYTIIKNTQ